MKSQIKKTIAILLAVLFLVTVTVTTVSAYTTVGGVTNDKNTIVIHHNNNHFGDHGGPKTNANAGLSIWYISMYLHKEAWSRIDFVPVM
jgi:hypothetical protein